MRKVGDKYKCIKTDSYKCFTEGNYYILHHITPRAKAYHGPLYWFYDNKNKDKFIVEYLFDSMFKNIKQERKEKLERLCQNG